MLSPLLAASVFLAPTLCHHEKFVFAYRVFMLRQFGGDRGEREKDVAVAVLLAVALGNIFPERPTIAHQIEIALILYHTLYLFVCVTRQLDCSSELSPDGSLTVQI